MDLNRNKSGVFRGLSVKCEADPNENLGSSEFKWGLNFRVNAGFQTTAAFRPGFNQISGRLSVQLSMLLKSKARGHILLTVWTEVHPG